MFARSRYVIKIKYWTGPLFDTSIKEQKAEKDWTFSIFYYKIIYLLDCGDSLKERYMIDLHVCTYFSALVVANAKWLKIFS